MSASDPFASQASPEPQRPSKSRFGLWVLLTLVIGFVMCGGLVTLMVGYLAVYSPETSVYPGSQVPSSYLSKARAVGALKADQVPKFFYSDGFLNIEEGFYLVTDSSVAIYSEDGRDPALTVIPFASIASAELTRNESFFEDSYISIETTDDQYHAFPVSSEFDRDQRFFDAIRQEGAVE
jgi:hypothetical protein